MSDRKQRREPIAEEKSSGGGWVFLALLAFMIAGVATVLVKRDVIKIDEIISKKIEPKPQPDPIRYETLKNQLADERLLLRERYMAAKSTQDQDAVIKDASALLEHMMPELMRCWLGHPWAFSGTASIPGDGEIACGYFVSVIMRDTGFKVQRFKLAQQPSQRIIRTFVPRKEMKITTGVDYADYADELQQDYDGINIVGLDNHVGFVVVKAGKLHFIHSGGLQRLVVDELRDDAYTLRVSNYRVIANISKNRDMLVKWLLNQPFPTA